MPLRRTTMAALIAALLAANGCATRPAPPAPPVAEPRAFAPAATEESALHMESRIFPYPVGVKELHGHMLGLEARLETFFGVTWPRGAHIRRMRAPDGIAVKNTPENLRLIEQALETIVRLSNYQIETQLEFVEYNMTDIDSLARENKLSADSLLALWRQGKAKLLHAPRVVTQGGQEANVKGVTEYIYPTAFHIACSKTTNATGSIVASGIVQPGSFATREVGAIFAVVPEISPDGQTIVLIMTPEIVHPPAWKDYGTVRPTPDGGKTELRMERPFFHKQTLTTQIMMSDGARVLVGGGMNNETGDKAVYVFATAWILDADGNPVRQYDPVLRQMEAEAQRNAKRPARASATDKVLADAGLIPMQVEIQADFVEYSMEDVDALARENRLDPDHLLALWRQGRGVLRYAPRIVAQPGQESTIIGATEYVYPTAFEIACTGATNAAGSSVVSGEVVPKIFETRDVGVNLAVLPDVSADRRMIRLYLTPVAVRPPAWKNYGPVRHAPDGGKHEWRMEQPFFHTHTLTTLAFVSVGGRVMIGGGMKNEEGDKTVYVFLTARLIDPEGRPISGNETAEPAAERQNHE